jgi:hypothetical protein
VTRGGAARFTTTRANFFGSRPARHHHISVSSLSPSVAAIAL